MGQFRDRMDEELRLRGYSASTRECYVRCVRNFVRHFMRPPDQLTLEHIRQYQLHLTRERQVSWAYFPIAGVGDRRRRAASFNAPFSPIALSRDDTKKPSSFHWRTSRVARGSNSLL
ncbi:MAG: phage integrase N-terminal SAM-like domain-containing protein [Candidatus Rokubacteria bacterium]|nr:phage integrase N-terminal SAM-like domain-containing protein [Candidatus Rokubacteria bacterium]